MAERRVSQGSAQGLDPARPLRHVSWPGYRLLGGCDLRSVMSEPASNSTSKHQGPDMTELLFAMILGKPAWMWMGFLAIVVLLLIFDLGVLHRKNRELGIADSLRLSAFYIAIALAFGAWIWWWFGTWPDGSSPAIEYLTGYFIEKSLSIDNVFVISLIFGYFGIPRGIPVSCPRLGILAVVILRGLMIGAGAALVQHYDWVLYLFGAFLIVTGFKMLVVPDNEPDLANNAMVRFLQAASARHGRAARGEVRRPPDRPDNGQARALRDAAAPSRSS